MKKLFPILVLISLMVSCSTPLAFQVSKPGDESDAFTQRMVYSLPRTLLKVDLEIEKEIYLPGPYVKFTERFLGLQDYIRETGFQYKIKSVEVETLTEPDPSMFYSVNIHKGSFNWEKYLLLSEKGFVLDPSALLNYSDASRSDTKSSSMPYFKDLSTNLNLKEVTDTLYKTVITDSSLVRLPVVTTARQVRTLEQKAEEAARNLFTIRENRFFLITNTEGDYPDGKALEIMIREMDEMEKNFVELFIGKVVRQKYTQSFVILPEDSDEKQVNLLGNFSSNNGLRESGNGLPLNLEISPLNNFRKIEGVTDFNSKGESVSNLLYYRIPDVAKVKVLLENELLYEGRQNIFQFGTLINIPVIE